MPRLRLVATTVALAALAVAAAGGVCPSGAVTSGTVTSQPYLLALGDSLAAGYQPLDGSSSPPLDPSTGFPDRGYPGGYAADLAAARHLDLADLACPGETTASMTGKPARTRCADLYRAELGASSQLGAALVFLSRHRGEVAIVTIDLGANDIEGCVAHRDVDAACLRRGAANVARRLPPILRTLLAAVARDDPGARLVGMNYYDPFLGLAFTPGGQRASAEAFLSLVLIDTYNAELASVYRRAGVPAADVFSAFDSDSTTPPLDYDSRALPRNVAAVCTWTWMCPVSPSQPAPDIHANTAGYRVIAVAFEAVLGS